MNKPLRQFNKGFTLIELIVVIVILGVLAATAAPKFLDLQRDSRIASLSGVEGALKSAVTIAGTKAITLAGGNGCYIVNKNNNGAIVAKNNGACPTIEIIDYPIETGFAIPIPKVAGIIYALSGEEGKLSGSGYQANNSYAEFFKSSSANNQVYQCADLNTNYCYLWVVNPQAPAVNKTSLSWGSIYIGNSSSFVKKTGNKTINESESCVLKYEMRWVMTADGKKAKSAEYRITPIVGGC